MCCNVRNVRNVLYGLLKILLRVSIRNRGVKKTKVFSHPCFIHLHSLSVTQFISQVELTRLGAGFGSAAGKQLLCWVCTGLQGFKQYIDYAAAYHAVFFCRACKVQMSDLGSLKSLLQQLGSIFHNLGFC